MKLNDSKSAAENIRVNYLPKEKTKLDDLRALDKSVKRPVKILAYVVGTLGALALGIGMSLVMTDLPLSFGVVNPMPVALIVGLVGIALCAANCPLYNALLKSRRIKYADRVNKLADEIADN